MMDREHQVTLPQCWLDRCQDAGERIVHAYATDPRSAASKAYAMNGIELDVEAQAFAKMGEVAFCLWAGLDPDAAVNWSALPDNGHDVNFGGVLLDIKTVEHYKKFLIWPVSKNAIYCSKRFHALILVKRAAPFFSVERWIDKAAFFCEHRVAEGELGLIPGTWFMPEADLWPMESFFGYFGRRFA